MNEDIWKVLFGTEGGRWAVSVCVAAAVCVACRARRALTTAGALAAFPVGLAAVAGGARCTSVLLTFFVLSTLATKTAAARKAALDHTHTAEVRRGRRPAQVLANGAVGTVLAFAHVALLGVWNDAISSTHDDDEVVCGQWHRVLYLAYVGAYAFGAADTFASEIGVLSRAPPRMVGSWRVVPRGTNGGVSALGTAAAALGGLLVGASGSLSFRVPDGLCFDWSVALTGLVVGLAGTTLDSVLGATLQYSGAKPAPGSPGGVVVVVAAPGKDVQHIAGRNVLSNTGVNFVACLASALLAPLLCCTTLF